MIPKRYGEEITLDDLFRLRENGVAEGKTIEYKRELPGANDGGNVKILRSITSFANTGDGDLLYGVETVDGAPTNFPGISIESQDLLRQRIDNLCRDGVQERLPHPYTGFIPLDNGNAVLLIRVRKSLMAPHRVTSGGHSQFYGRNGSGSYPLDVPELRTAFSLGETLAQRIRSFRAERILAVANAETPIPLNPGCKLIVHLIPAPLFSNQSQVDIKEVISSRRLPIPIGMANYNDFNVNLEGV
ncbi:MAG TPA: ATP-binding protein [Burkholderiales bacterium]|nr:ATP-binding protein [Burkholderiales bacterium]